MNGPVVTRLLRFSMTAGYATSGFSCSGGTQNVECAKIEHLAMGVNDFETCPRCGGTGADPDPAQGWRGGGLAEALLAPLIDWIVSSTLALFFPRLNARCRDCRGKGKIPKGEQG